MKFAVETAAPHSSSATSVSYTMMNRLNNLFDLTLHIPQRLLQMKSARPEEGWTNFLTQVAHRMTDREFAEGFQKAVPVEGADASEYNYRLIEKEDIALVTSLRFKALTLSEPFVEILLCDRALDRPTLERVGEIAKKEYARFQPDRIRYLSLNDTPFYPEDEEDFAFFIGDTPEIQTGAKPSRYYELDLQPATSLDFYPRLQKVYEDVNRESEEFLWPEQLITLETSLKQGLLFEAFVSNEWAGMIAAHNRTERFFTGIYIVEEAIDTRFRGKGFGSAMQRKFIDRLERDTLVFGEILKWNMRSRNTAMSVGREKCGATYFHAIE